MRRGERNILKIVVTLVLVALIVLGAISRRNASLRDSIKQVTLLNDSLRLGGTRLQVMQIVNQHISLNPGWVVHSDNRPDIQMVSVNSPYVIGANNWVIHLGFVDDVLVGIGVRTADGERIKPISAPPDRVAEGYVKRWVGHVGQDRSIRNRSNEGSRGRRKLPWGSEQTGIAPYQPSREPSPDSSNVVETLAEIDDVLVSTATFDDYVGHVAGQPTNICWGNRDRLDMIASELKTACPCGSDV